MKKYMKTYLMAGAVAVVLCGCQSKNEEISENEMAVETEETVENDLDLEEYYIPLAKETVGNIVSFASDFNVKIDIENDLPLDIQTKILLENSDNFVSHIQVEEEGTTKDTFLEQYGENIIIFNKHYNEWTEIKYAYDEALRVIGVYNGIENFKYFLETGTDWREINPVEPTEKDVITAVCTIPANKVHNMIDNTFLFYFTGMNQIGEECYENVSDVDVTLQFTKTGEPLSINLDLSETLETTTNYIIKQLNGDGVQEQVVNNYEIKQSFYDLNEVQNIDIPVEVRGATNYGNEVTILN